LHGIDIQERDGFFVDRQPDGDTFQIAVATARFNLGMKESCSEERPLPRARQVDSNAIDDASPLQCHPFVSYGVGNFLGFFRCDSILVSFGHESLHGLHGALVVVSGTAAAASPSFGIVVTAVDLRHDGSQLDGQLFGQREPVV